MAHRGYHRFIVAFLVLSAGAASPSFAGDGERRSLFSESSYREHLSYLASDRLEGRGTGQAGNDKAAEYIADHFAKCGLKPAGDDGTFFQNFSLNLQKQIGDETRLAYQGRRTPFRNLRLNKDYRPLPFSSSGEIEGDVVFVGYGIVNRDKNYDDYDGVDVDGKIVLMLRHGPRFAGFEQDEESFRSKASKANARDAAAILLVNRDGDDDAPLFDFETQDSMGGFRPSSYGIPMVHLTREATDKLLKAAGMQGIRELEKKIESKKGPASATLNGVVVKANIEIEPKKTPARNVMGVIRGKGPQADEYIVLGAHYDHLGIRRKGETNFDSKKDIYNGADDNASGTALVMSMAEAFSRGEKPNRSLLLMTYSGEELGLLGSQHFASHPTVNLKKCIAMLNFDMVGRLKDDQLEVGGMRTGGFERIVDEAAERYDIKVKDGGGGRGPSDHTSFYNKDIPVLFFFTGLHRQYHQPEDDIELINYDGALRIAKMAGDIVDEIDGRSTRPKFASDNRSPILARQREKSDGAEERPQRAVTAAPTGKGVRLGIVPKEDSSRGLAVASVADGSPAQKAGIKAGDTIVRIGALRVENLEDAKVALGKLSSGDQIGVRIVRNGKASRVRVRFGSEAREKTGGETGDWNKELANSIQKLASELDADGAAITPSPKGNTGFETTVQIAGARDWKSVWGKFATVLSEALPDDSAARDKQLKLSIAVNKSANGSLELKMSLTVEKKSDRESRADANKKNARAQTDHGVRRDESDPHGDAAGKDDSGAVASMPRVRLGIMPTYSEAEGEGYPISGVVEGGAAAKAGMKDSDRIFLIGKTKITNVYEYMDALRQFKPGDTIPVTIIRDGKKMNLKITAARPQTKEAA